MLKLKSNESGFCPFCNSANIDFDSSEMDFPYMWYPWTCLDCGKEGYEYYKIEFIGHNILDDNNDSVVVTDDMIEKE